MEQVVLVRPEQLSLLFLFLLHSCITSPESPLPKEVPVQNIRKNDEVLSNSPQEKNVTKEILFREALDSHKFQKARELWISDGPFLYEDLLEQENTLRRLFSSSLVQPSEMGNVSVLEIFEDDLWIGTWNGGVYRYALPTAEWTTLMEPLPSLSVNTVFAIRSEGPSIWIMQYNRILRYWKNSSSLEVQSMNPPVARMKDLVFFADQPLIGTALNGLYNRKRGETQWSQNYSFQPAGLQINQLIPDETGIYICTADRGLYYWNGKELFSLYRDILPDNITSVEYWDNSLWVGSYGEGLFRIDPDEKVFHYTEKEGRFSDDWILSSKQTEEYIFWGTLGGGITFFSKEKKQATLGLSEGLGSMDIADIEWYNNSLYAGTLGGGISVIHETLLDFRIQNP